MRILAIALLAGVVAADVPADRVAFVRNFVKGLEETRLGLRVVTVIWDLPYRYGTFADIDGDGDRDYLATEMSHRAEELVVFRRDGRTWTRAGRASRLFRGRHPLEPWLVPDDGRGRRAVLVPTGWPPYFVVIPAGARGTLQEGEAFDLQGLLPRRRSKPAGVDNNPYRIERIVPRAGGGSVIAGIMEDGTRRVRFRIELRAARPHGTRRPAPVDFDASWKRPVAKIAQYDEPPDRRDAREAMRRLRLREGRPDLARRWAPPNDPKSLHHKTVLGRHRFDGNGDGIDDLVVITTDFAAHVFPGSRAKSGTLTFAEEAAAPECLRIHRVRRLWGGTEEDVARSPGTFAEILRYRLHVHGARRTVPLSVVTDFGTAHIQYRRERGRLIPSMLRRSHFPTARGAKTTYHYESHACLDSSGDGVPELFQVALVTRREPGHPLERLGAHFFLWRGVVPDRLNGYLDLNSSEAVYPAFRAVFPATIRLPDDPHLGLPIELESVRVEGAAGGARYCVYFRPWRVGIFLEPR